MFQPSRPTPAFLFCVLMKSKKGPFKIKMAVLGGSDDHPMKQRTIETPGIVLGTRWRSRAF